MISNQSKKFVQYTNFLKNKGIIYYETFKIHHFFIIDIILSSTLTKYWQKPNILECAAVYLNLPNSLYI